jgi:hypothetical protein
MIREQGLSHVEVSKKLSIPKGMIGNWAAGIGLGTVKANPGDQSIGELKAGNAKLRKELAESRMERDIRLERRTLRRSQCKVRVHKGASRYMADQGHGACA